MASPKEPMYAVKTAFSYSEFAIVAHPIAVNVPAISAGKYRLNHSLIFYFGIIHLKQIIQPDRLDQF